MKKLIISITSLLTFLLIGAGWYFSGLIYEVGLNPEFADTQDVGTAEDRVVVEKISSSSISLNVEEEQWGVMLENGIYGIIGQNGEGVIGKIINTEGNIIERELVQINGSLVKGDRVSSSSGLLLDEERGVYKILGTSGWSGQAT